METIGQTIYRIIQQIYKIQQKKKKKTQQINMYKS